MGDYRVTPVYWSVSVPDREALVLHDLLEAFYL